MDDAQPEHRHHATKNGKVCSLVLDVFLFFVLGNIPETSSKASVYALACNPAGTVLATGSPEKVYYFAADDD